MIRIACIASPDSDAPRRVVFLLLSPDDRKALALGRSITIDASEVDLASIDQVTMAYVDDQAAAMAWLESRGIAVGARLDARDLGTEVH